MRFRSFIATLATLVASVSVSWALTNYPSALDNNTTLFHVGTGQVASKDHHNNLKDAVIAIQTQLGVNNSAVPGTIDYLLKNLASADPGHTHTYASLPVTVARYDLAGTFLAAQDFAQGLTVSPFFTLAANGDMTKIRGIAYHWPTLQGTPGQALVNDGTGILTWETITAAAASNAGAIQFNTGGLFDGDDTKLFWNSAVDRLGILTNTPDETFSVADKFLVDSTGNLVEVNDVVYSWPAAQGGALTVLQNDGAGNLSWASVASAVSGSGAAGQVSFWDGASSLTGNNDFWWDDINSRLGILTITPDASFSVADKFLVDSNGNLTKVNDVVYSWPAVQGGIGTTLIDDGAGNLTWTNTFSVAKSFTAAGTGLTVTNGATVGSLTDSGLTGATTRCVRATAAGLLSAATVDCDVATYVVKDTESLPVDGTRYVRTSTTQFNTSAAENDLTSVTLASFPGVGRVYHLRLAGDLAVGTGGADTFQYRVYIGGTAVCDTGAIDPTPTSVNPYVLDVDLTIRTAGAAAIVQCDGSLTFGDDISASLGEVLALHATSGAIDLDGTPAIVIKTTNQFSNAAAGNEVNETSGVIQIVNQ